MSPAISLPPSFGKSKVSVLSSRVEESPKQKLNLACCFGRIAGLSPILSEEKKVDLCVRNLENDYEAEEPHELNQPVFKEKRSRSEEPPRDKTPVVRLAIKCNLVPSKSKKLMVRDCEGLKRLDVLGDLNGLRP